MFRDSRPWVNRDERRYDHHQADQYAFLCHVRTPTALARTLQRNATKAVIAVTLRSGASGKAQKRDGRHILAAGNVTGSLQGERTPPPTPPDGRSRKFAKEGHTGPAPAGFYFAPRGVGQMGLELIGAFTMIGIVVAMLVLIFHFLVP
jgi:hypothetical protein